MPWGDNDENEEEEEEIEDSYKTVDDHIIFLIDAREAMFQPNRVGEVVPVFSEQRNSIQVYIVNALKVALAVMKSKIISSEKDTVGIVFLGAKKVDPGTDVSNEYVCTFCSLETPSADRIVKLQKIIDNPELLREEIIVQPASTATCPLKEAIWSCVQAFNAKASKSHADDFRRIWLFTNDDAPNKQDIAEQRRILQVASDAAETGAEISLWHMNAPNKQFNTALFYSTLLSTQDDSDLEFRMKGAGDDSFDTMLGQLRKKMYRKRALGTIPLLLSPDMHLHCAVTMYKTIQPTKKPSYVWLHALTSQPADTKTMLIDQSTGAVLDAADSTATVTTYIDINGERVPFSKEDMINVKTLPELSLEPCVRVLYFAPASALTPELNYTASTFLYPNNSTTKGSSDVFTALLQKMITSSLIAVGLFMRNKSSMPRYVAIVPQAEGDVYTGLSLIVLPFAQEIRNVPMNDMHVPDDDAVAAAEELITALQFEDDFNHTQLENPAIQHFYGVLQAVALQQEQSEWSPDRDQMVPDPEGLEAARDKLLQFKAAVGLGDVGALPAKAKRGKAADGETAPKKKARAEPVDDGTNFDINDLKSRSPEQETVATLKDICKFLGLPVSGTKPVLLDRIQVALSK